jgi:hypothetical protein
MMMLLPSKPKGVPWRLMIEYKIKKNNNKEIPLNKCLIKN